MRYSFFVVVLLFIVTSCSSASPTNIAIGSAQVSDVTNTIPPQPTLTRKTSTPVPSATPDVTETIFAQDSFTDRAANETLLAQYSSTCETIYAPRVFSPNQEWMVEFCYSANDGDLVLAFLSKENKKNWKFSFRDFIPQTDNIPDGGMSVVHWTSDGRYAYFRSYISGDGGECFQVDDNDGLGLFRLDLQNGNITTILPPRNNFGWYDFTFSPTDRRLVYGDYGRDLKILDIKTGALIGIQSPSPFSQAGGYLWASDGLGLLYSTVLYDEIGQFVEYTLRWVDIDSGTEQVLLKSAQSCFKVQSWKDNNIVAVESFDQSFNVTIVEYDLKSKQVLSESTTTPFP